MFGAKGGMRRRDDTKVVRLRRWDIDDLRAVCLVRAIADDLTDDLDEDELVDEVVVDGNCGCF